ncbi:hypothetical protein CPAR01_15056 [Colletotrichum paranaense]|uniref:Uncharacterized protein n=1 Tax=Colletotrichum paranaense TaxID=1914294 RepID=A0ABQ9S217_9PEZI|nr:uncharacterized protein CPAR01_15056 [Colletotrichum paranaense]KAK1521533.1 hypothetical protein CPAR01_15056 [Colletotrichum paranaense]
MVCRSVQSPPLNAELAQSASLTYRTTIQGRAGDGLHAQREVC